MSPITFLVYGSNGWIGSQVCEYINRLKRDDLIVYHGSSRADDEAGVEQELLLIKPTHVMCFIGRTHGKIGDKIYPTIDYLEQKDKLTENVKDNIYSPLVLAILCKKYQIHLSYLGTGCIFEYDVNHPMNDETHIFTEQDRPNFFGSSYSTVKGYTDRLMHLFDDSVLNIRIRMPITSQVNSRNFITKIVNYKKICSIPNSMTVLDDMIPIIVDLAINNKTGTFNMTNPGVITHNEVLNMYKEIIDPNHTWENFTIEEQDQVLAAKRSNNHLDASKLSSLYPVLPIKESVKQVLIRMSENINSSKLSI